jgi:hypothetical protein
MLDDERESWIGCSFFPMKMFMSERNNGGFFDSTGLVVSDDELIDCACSGRSEDARASFPSSGNVTWGDFGLLDSDESA